MSIRSTYFFEASGHEFESGVVDAVSSFAKREWGIEAVKSSTMQQDRFEGTDLYVLGVPIDITLSFEKKNKTRRLGALTMDGVVIDFGIRLGNHRANFKMPVLVIGASTAIGITKANLWLVLGIIKDNIQEILNIGMDKYFVATEA